MVDSVTLKVAEANQQDVGSGRARIDTKTRMPTGMATTAGSVRFTTAMAGSLILKQSPEKGKPHDHQENGPAAPVLD